MYELETLKKDPHRWKDLKDLPDHDGDESSVFQSGYILMGW